MSDKWLGKSLKEMIKGMQEIKRICQAAKRHGIEEKDIDDILIIIKQFV